MRRLALILSLFLSSIALLPVLAQSPSPHPRLWLTPEIVTRLRTWATPTNPLYADGLALLAERAKTDMDEGRVPGEDCGQRAYTEYPTESYAMFFAFMSHIAPDEAAHQDYTARARTLLMHVMNIAAQGPAAEDDQSHRCPGDPDSPAYPPYRDPRFFTEDSDRLRWYGEGFPLTVDWIYSSLSVEDKNIINKVFTRWGREIIERAYHHPEPIDVVNDPTLTADRQQVRWAGNNYFAAHMRNLAMLSMALDPADSSPELQGYLSNATGAWLYLFDALIRTDARGGLLPEGIEYSPQTASYVLGLHLALRTAGHADPARHGPQVVFDSTPFWDDFVSAYLHSLSPTTTNHPDDGPLYLPAWYGDGQRYRLPDFVDVFGLLGAYDQIAGNAARLNAARWIQTHIPIGGADGLIERTRNPVNLREAILYFMLFDPAAPPATDPRPALPTTYYAPGMNRLFSRTGWGPEASWLTYALSWNSIDHQQADGNHVELYRNGEWLTKARTGYANIAEGIASSEFRNTLAIQNARPLDRSDDDWRIDLWLRGSQWNLVPSGDPSSLTYEAGSGYVYMAGDATNLYNSEYEGATEVKHASRALIWLQPDFLIVYDRADAPAKNFKRVWWQLPTPGTITGNSARMETAKGQQLFITALAPDGLTLRAANPANDNVGETVATDEPMKERVYSEAPPTDRARFLHVVQGADAGAAPAAAVLIRGTAGGPYEGAAVNGSVILFPVEMGQAFSGLTYTAPAGTTLHLITGLAPNAAYTVSLTPGPDGIAVTVSAGGPLTASAAGVLAVR